MKDPVEVGPLSHHHLCVGLRVGKSGKQIPPTILASLLLDLPDCPAIESVANGSSTMSDWLNPLG